MTDKKVLIVNKMHESIIPSLEEIGLKVDYEPDIKKEKVLHIIDQYVGIIVRSKLELDKPFLDKATNLKFIARAGAGLDQIDMYEVRKRGIEVFNAPEGNRDTLAEHTLALLLALLTNITKANNEVKAGIWNRDNNRGFELKSKTVGIVGFGYMGRAFSEKLIGLGCKVVSLDIKPSVELPTHVERVDWEEFTNICDIVSIHVPLTDSTKYMINDQWLSSFKKNIWLINTSRGSVLKLKDLIKNLDKGKVKGAALDVLENENLRSLNPDERDSFENLIKRDNVIITPHIGGWSEESYLRINNVLISKIKDFILHNG